MSKKILVRNRNHRLPTLLPTLDEIPHPTKQEFKKEVNVNTIMAKARNGVFPPAWLTSKTPIYGDFSNHTMSFSEAFNAVDSAYEAFYALPIEMRKELGHEPKNLLNAPRDLFAKYGLLKESAMAQSKASLAPQARPEGPQGKGAQGDGNLPSKAPTGANKGAKSAPSSSQDEG